MVIPRTIRTITERLARGRSITRRLPAEFGRRRICISPDASLRHLLPGQRAFDPFLFMIVRRLVKPGMQVWDIGSNIGQFMATAAGKAGPEGRVLAAEPDPWLVRLLEKTRRMTLPNEAPIELAPVAISSGSGSAQLNVARRGRASSWIGDGPGGSQSGGSRGTQTVPTSSLDDLMRKHFPPDLVKIDIEGAEHDALRGARALLEEVRPIIVIEVSEKNREGVTTTLHDLGYSLHDAENPDFPDIPACSFNTLARPK